MIEYLLDVRILMGAVIGAVVMYFVYHNNQSLMNRKFDEMKVEFDKNEKELRAKAEELLLEDKIKKILEKLGVKA